MRWPGQSAGRKRRKALACWSMMATECPSATSEIPRPEPTRPQPTTTMCTAEVPTTPGPAGRIRLDGVGRALPGPAPDGHLHPGATGPGVGGHVVDQGHDQGQGELTFEGGLARVRGDLLVGHRLHVGLAGGVG